MIFKHYFIFSGGFGGWPSGAGRRVIINHIGSRNGFLKGARDAFIGHSKNQAADYHTEMNSQHFIEWFTKVLDLLPDRSIVVLDQASYHKKIEEGTKNPRSNWRKSEIIKFLIDNNFNVPHPYSSFQDMNVPNLRQLAATKKNVEVKVVESLATKCGKNVKVLWLPVAHCELNPIELVWATVKSE